MDPLLSVMTVESNQDACVTLVAMSSVAPTVAIKRSPAAAPMKNSANGPGSSGPVNGREWWNVENLAGMPNSSMVRVGSTAMSPILRRKKISTAFIQMQDGILNKHDGSRGNHPGYNRIKGCAMFWLGFGSAIAALILAIVIIVKVGSKLVNWNDFQL